MKHDLNDTEKKSRFLAALALLALLAGHLAFNTWWLGQDRHPVHGREAGLVSHSVLLHGVLTSPAAGSLTQRLWLAGQVEGDQPPLLSLAGAISAGVAGLSVDGIIAANTVLFLLLLCGTYLLAREVFEGRRGVSCIAAAAAGFTPMIAGASRLMVPELASTAMLLLCLWALLRAKGLQSAPWSIAAGLFAGLGLLSDTTFALWLFAPALAAVAMAMIVPAPARHKHCWANLALFLAVAFSCSATWYYHNAQSLLTQDTRPLRNLPAMYLALGGYTPPEDFAIQPHLPVPDLPQAIDASASLVAPKEPPAHPPQPKPARRSPWPAYAGAIFSSGLILTLVLAIMGLATTFLAKAGARGPRLLVAATAVSGVLFLGLARSPEPEHLLPLLPLLVILAAAALYQIPWRLPRRVLLALYLGFLAVQFANLSVAPFAGNTPLAPAVLMPHNSYTMGPPWHGGNLYESTFATVQTAAADAAFVTLQPINAAGFRVLAQQYWPPAQSGRPVVVPLDPEFISEPDHLDGLNLSADFYLLALGEGSGGSLPARWLDRLTRMRAEIVEVTPSPAYGSLPEARLVLFRLPHESGIQ